MRTLKQMITCLLILAMMLAVGIPAAAAEDDESRTLKNGTYKNVLIDTSTFGHGFIISYVFGKAQTFTDISEQNIDGCFAELSYTAKGKTRKVHGTVTDFCEPTYDEYELRMTDVINNMDYIVYIWGDDITLLAEDGTNIDGKTPKIKLGAEKGAGLPDETVIYNGSDLKEKLTALEVSEYLPRYRMGALIIKDEVSTQVVFNDRYTYEGDFEDSWGLYHLKNGSYQDITLLTPQRDYDDIKTIFWQGAVTPAALAESEERPDCLELTCTAKNKTRTFRMYEYIITNNDGEYIINGRYLDDFGLVFTFKNGKVEVADEHGTYIVGKSPKLKAGDLRTLPMGFTCKIYNGTDKKESLGWNELPELLNYADKASVDVNLKARFGTVNTIFIQKKIKGLKEMRAANGVQTGNDVPYTIRVEDGKQEIYSGPGYGNDVVRTFGNKGTFTIVEEAWDNSGNLWGKLKSGVGWVPLSEVQN